MSCFVAGGCSIISAMNSDEFVQGEMRQWDTPDWRALEVLLDSDDLCAHFMWMHDVVLDDGTVLNAYKHRWTRRYFHLAEDGRSFYYAGDELYHELDPHTAMKTVFATWQCCKPTPEEKKALRAALRKAATRTKSQ
jgi:hypothetical protein